jgi:hypothetical protein
VVEPGCLGDLDQLADRVRKVVAAQDPPPVVVAHGLGATVALAAGGEVERYVLLGPVLGVPRSAAIDAALDRLPGPVARDVPAPWNGRDLRTVLLGDPVPPLTCFPPGLAAEIRTWRERGLPLRLDRVDAPVWMAVGLLDEVAPVEVAVPASRALAERTVVRLGIAHLDPRDYTHRDLLLDPVPIRAAVRAAVPR